MVWLRERGTLTATLPVQAQHHAPGGPLGNGRLETAASEIASNGSCSGPRSTDFAVYNRPPSVLNRLLLTTATIERDYERRQARDADWSLVTTTAPEHDYSSRPGDEGQETGQGHQLFLSQKISVESNHMLDRQHGVEQMICGNQRVRPQTVFNCDPPHLYSTDSHALQSHIYMAVFLGFSGAS